MLESKHCAVLVPYAHSIEPECEYGLRGLEAKGYKVFRIQGSAIDQMRSAMATDALAAGFHEILWIDSDIGFTPSDADLIRSHGKPIVAGLYAMKGGSGVAARYLDAKPPKFGAGAGLHEIDLAGAGFLYTRREVYTSLSMPRCNLKGREITPYFLPMLASHRDGLEYLGEDFSFCRRAREKGFKIFADTSIRLRHIGRYGFEIESSAPAPIFRKASIWSEKPKIACVLVDSGEPNLEALCAAMAGRDWHLVLAQTSEAPGECLMENSTTLKLPGATWGQAINLGACEAVKHGEAILICESESQFFSRLQLLDEAVQRNAAGVIGSSVTIRDGAEPETITADPENIWRLPLSAGVLHKSAIPTDGLVAKFETGVGATAWSRIAATPIFFREINAEIRNKPTEINDPEQHAVHHFNTYSKAPKLERAWERVVEIDSSKLCPADLHFNPSIIRRGGKLLMAYRFDVIDKETPDLKPWERHSDIGIALAELGDDLQPLELRGGRLDLDGVGNLGAAKVEDPRLFEHAGEMFVSYTNSFPVQGRAAMGLMRIDGEWKSWFWPFGRNVCKENKPLRAGGPIPKGMEKNWAYFSHDGELFAVYDTPRQVVLKLDLEANTVTRFAGSDREMKWAYGEIRGGTPPVRVGEEYFAFFHSSFFPRSTAVFNRSIYAMGMYAFKAKAPFEITRFTPEPLMVGSIHDPCPQRPAVVFPAGAVHEDGRWLVSYGHNDFKCKIAEFDHQRLLKLCRRP